MRGFAKIIPIIGSLVFTVQAALADGTAAMQHFHDIQASGGSAPEQEYLDLVGGRPTPQANQGGSGLDLVRKDRSSTTSLGGGGGVLTLANAAQVLEGKQTISITMPETWDTWKTHWFEIRNGRLLRHVDSSTSDLGSVTECMQGCGGLPPYWKYYITAHGVSMWNAGGYLFGWTN